LNIHWSLQTKLLHMQDKDTILKALRHQSRFFTPRKTKTGVMEKA